MQLVSLVIFFLFITCGRLVSAENTDIEDLNPASGGDVEDRNLGGVDLGSSNPASCALETFQSALRYMPGGYKRGANPCNPALCKGPNNYCQCSWSMASCATGQRPDCPVTKKCSPCRNGWTCDSNGFSRPKKLRSEDKSSVSSDGSWQSFPTPAPKKPTNSNTKGVKCSNMSFGECRPGEYCKSKGYDTYRCTICERGCKCSGDGKKAC